MSDKIVKYKKPFSINIGLIIFLMIIVYVMFSVYLYYSRRTIAEYEVAYGSIASNNTYRGIAIRNEKVVYADQEGFLNYYQPNASKVSIHDMIYSVDAEGLVKNAIQSNMENVSLLSPDSLEQVNESLDGFTNGYQALHYYDLVQYQAAISSEIDQAVNNQALTMLSSEVSAAVENNAFYKGYSDVPGVILYYTDGFEDLTTDTLTYSDIQNTTYEKNFLNSRETIKNSEAAYKIVTDETWYVGISVSQDTADELTDKSSAKIRFQKDGYTTNASYTIRQSEGENLLILKLNKAMIRYANDRFLDIELVLYDETGLKIPNSSITAKEFYTIPKAYFMQGGDSSALGIMVNRTKDNSKEAVFVSPTIYFETEDYYYIDDETVSKGEEIKSSDGESYQIGTDTASLEGVYNINKGYAVFKQISKIVANEEYTIVESKTAYGISLYDHIALDASSLHENELIIE